MSELPRLWEVFLRSPQGMAHRHVGSVQASDARMALLYARDVYARRGDVVSLWILPTDQILVSDPAENANWFESAVGKEFRQASYYPVPDGVENL